MNIYRRKCSDGRTRNMTKQHCIECNTEFFSRVRKNGTIPNFCSQICSAKNRSKIGSSDVTCAFCNNQFRKHNGDIKNSKNGLFFCKRECKDKAQRLGGIKEIQPPHYGTADPELNYRQKYIDAGFKLICNRCDYKEFECSIDIHHIDKNHSNNNIENLIALCACCHKAIHSNLYKIEDIKNKL